MGSRHSLPTFSLPQTAAKAFDLIAPAFMGRSCLYRSSTNSTPDVPWRGCVGCHWLHTALDSVEQQIPSLWSAPELLDSPISEFSRITPEIPEPGVFMLCGLPRTSRSFHTKVRVFRLPRMFCPTTSWPSRPRTRLPCIYTDYIRRGARCAGAKVCNT